MCLYLGIVVELCVMGGVVGVEVGILLGLLVVIIGGVITFFWGMGESIAMMY